MKPKKVVVAYSGGLDTSIIIPWLKENYSCEVIAMTGDVGQGEELEGLREKALATGARLEIGHLPEEAVEGAHAVYTDVWASMGFEHEAEERAGVFLPFRVTPELFARARPDAVFMHCLPAHRGEEVAEQVIEAPRSMVFDQAENRLHVAKAILLMLLGK